MAQGQQLGLMPMAGSLARRLHAMPRQRICCRYTVSQHPKVEAKIVAELQQLGLMPTAQQPQPRDLEYADMSELTYLQAVVKVQACMSGLANLKVCIGWFNLSCRWM